MSRNELVRRFSDTRDRLSVELLVIGALAAGVLLTIVLHSLAIALTAETAVHRTIQLVWFPILVWFLATTVVVRRRTKWAPETER